MWGEDSENIMYYMLYICSCSMWEGGFRRAEPGALSLVEHNAFKGLGGRCEIEDNDEDEDEELRMRNQG